MQTPVTVIVTINASPEYDGSVYAALSQLIPPTQLEEGCIRYALYRDNKDPHRYVVIGEFADTDALDAHDQSPHLKLTVMNLSGMATIQVARMTALFVQR